MLLVVVVAPGSGACAAAADASRINFSGENASRRPRNHPKEARKQKEEKPHPVRIVVLIARIPIPTNTRISRYGSGKGRRGGRILWPFTKIPAWQICVDFESFVDRLWQAVAAIVCFALPGRVDDLVDQFAEIAESRSRRPKEEAIQTSQKSLVDKNIYTSCSAYRSLR